MLLLKVTLYVILSGYVKDFVFGFICFCSFVIGCAVVFCLVTVAGSVSVLIFVAAVSADCVIIGQQHLGFEVIC